GPLQNNGGPTLTRSPLPGSPVIDGSLLFGVLPGVPPDQRGFRRFVGTEVDIGAVAVQTFFKSTVGVFDPNAANWFLRNSNTSGAPDIAPFSFGFAGWLPVVGDWNGDGKATIGVVDPSTMTWYLRNSNSPGSVDFAPFQFGAPGWIPVV